MRRLVLIALAIAILILLPQFLIASDVTSRVVSIAGVCLLLWITEAVPPFVPTLLLWLLIPVALAPLDGRYSLQNVLAWAMDPVIILFFGGFLLGVALEHSEFGDRLAALGLRVSSGSYLKFLAAVMLTTAFFSMWISNVAAASLMLAALTPVLARMKPNDGAHSGLLLGVAFGADFGGMATPVGTGPNAIAIASISHFQHVSFVTWMAFAFPLTIGMLAFAFVLLALRVRASTANRLPPLPPAHARSETFAPVRLLVVFALTILLWLTEPLHRVPAATVALAAAVALFSLRILSPGDLRSVDWSTLMLIAGGITLGRLLERSELVTTLASNVPFTELHPSFSLFLICFASALLAALMSNTATVVLLIPIATALFPAPSTAILVAISASFGVVFPISTPPNAMAMGRGELRFADMFWPGLVLMIVGCALVSLTGKAVLQLVGVP